MPHLSSVDPIVRHRLDQYSARPGEWQTAITKTVPGSGKVHEERSQTMAEVKDKARKSHLAAKKDCAEGADALEEFRGWAHEVGRTIPVTAMSVSRHDYRWRSPMACGMQ